MILPDYDSVLYGIYNLMFQIIMHVLPYENYKIFFMQFYVYDIRFNLRIIQYSITKKILSMTTFRREHKMNL